MQGYVALQLECTSLECSAARTIKSEPRTSASSLSDLSVAVIHSPLSSFHVVPLVHVRNRAVLQGLEIQAAVLAYSFFSVRVSVLGGISLCPRQEACNRRQQLRTRNQDSAPD